MIATADIEYLTEYKRLNAHRDPFSIRGGLLSPVRSRHDIVLRMEQYQRRTGYLTILEARDALVRKYAWAVPTRKAIEVSPIVEMGAGTGYWASLLAAQGADIVCYDSHPPHESMNAYRHTETYHTIHKGNPAALRAHADRSLFLCWPPMTNMALRSLQLWQGRWLIYVGEHGGCNANDAFFIRLEKHFEEVKTMKLPQWFGIHDYLTIYQRI